MTAPEDGSAENSSSAGTSSGSVGRSRLMGTALLVVGLFGLLAPYTGEPLGFLIVVRPIVEVVDHVVPGVVLVAVAAIILVTNRIPLIAALIAVLAGLWMTTTHLPLLVQASQGQVGWAAAWWHTAPGVVLLILSAVAVAVAWREAPSS